MPRWLLALFLVALLLALVGTVSIVLRSGSSGDPARASVTRAPG